MENSVQKHTFWNSSKFKCNICRKL